MRLTDKQIYEYRNKLSRLCHQQPMVFSNGTFEFNNVLESDKNMLERALKNQNYIVDINIVKSTFDFSHFSFNKGFAEPKNKYTIRGILNLNIDEEIEIHKTLNPKIWGSDNELLPEVKEKIKAIVSEFKKELDTNKIDLNIKDVYILGSNANYNYNDDSDLDIHIIADETNDCSEKHLQIIYNVYKTLFNLKYDINIKGINAEIYVENSADLTNASSGIYSLNAGWIQDPAKFEIPTIDEVALDKKVSEFEDKYLELAKNPDESAINSFIDKIYDLRIKSLQKEGEFGLGNLVFKELRRLGYLENLKNILISIKNKELSLK